ncbi:YceI family protein [Puniceicoccaceae bacterium K14]|nr:YceI family protein [Puniceicoccaceae bacterium K14]
MKKLNRLAVPLLALFSSACIHAADFDLKDPKGVNNISFSLDAPLESIQGTTTGISGTVAYDPEAPEKTTGKVVVDATSLHLGNGKMLEHMVGKGWLDVEKYPEITFDLQSLSNVETDGNKTTATATGVMSIKGETKEITAPITLTYLEGMMEKRSRVPGDLLVVRSKFSINRSDFGLKPGENLDKVAEEVEVSLSLAGSYAH